MVKNATEINGKRRYSGEYKVLGKLGFPVLLTQLGVILMAFTDTMMVGAYGVDELAASAFVNSVFLIPLVMLSGLGSGITPLAGALFTRGELAEAGRTARAGLQVNGLAGLLFTSVMGCLYFFLDRFGQDAELMPVIGPYYLILLGTLLPMALFNVLGQTSNGLTDTRTPMWFILMAVVLNIVLNYVLIFGHWGFPRLGLQGAGIATVVSRVAGLAGIGAVYLSSRRYRECRKGLKEGKGLSGLRRKVWVTSYPVMIQHGIECSLWSFGAVACGWFGKIQLAAYQVVNTIGQLGFMTYISLGVAVSIRVANFTGLGDASGAGRAARAGLRMNLLLATAASAAMLCFGHGLIGAFSSDRAVVVAGEALLLPLVLYQYLDAIQLTFINAIRGTSQVKPLLWIAVVSYVAVGVPVLLLFSVVLGWESTGVYLSFNVALLVAAVYARTVFRRLEITPPPAAC